MSPSVFIPIFLHLFFLVFFMLHFGVSREIVCIPSERETLMKLKLNLTDPSNRLFSWNPTSNSNCCNWPGVVCSNVTSHVLQLHLNTSPPDVYDYTFDGSSLDLEAYEKAAEAYGRTQFGGEINPCLVDLKHLNYLDFSGNHLLGLGMPIPSFFGTMTSLTHLDLSNAGFMGKIPHQIGNLSNLVYLDLQSFFYESLFVENVEWLSSMSKLEYIDLGRANLIKSFDWLQTLQALPSLKHLCLSECSFPIHYNQPSLLNFSSLLTLDLSYVSFSFSPKWIFGLTKLVSLQLSNNNIQGPIPDGFQNLTLLENLDLSYNSFSSSIPHWLHGLHYLKSLNLRSNNLQGVISDALGNLTSLLQLDLSYNEFKGTIPTSLGDLCNLRDIHFSHLKLSQRVDHILEILAPCISHGLTTLEVSDSQLSGNLTDQLGIFKNIIDLDFSNNLIGGALPKSFGKLPSLRYLDLSKNQLCGNPFESLRSLYNLSRLDIGDNHFHGIVEEDHLANLTSLEEFYASGNNLTLKVRPNWLPSFQLSELDMSWWNLGPKFPSWVASQNKLGYLKMSKTGILDSIPTWIWETFSQVYYLNLSHNHIHGELATTFKHAISIRSVDLSSNDLHGKLPYLSDKVYWLDLSSNSFSESMTHFLCNKQFEQFELNLLNLASNNLSGKIPDCWIKWPYLNDVNLQNNHIVGSLPTSMGSLAGLESLNICNNALSGKFPTILKKNNQLISLDLGENNHSGIIPSWIGEKLPNLKVLRLRSNKFSGHIPNEICDMIFLQDLDLAHNSLSGNIPNCFNHLNAMLQKNKSTDLYIHSNASGPGVKIFDTISILLWTKGRALEYNSILGLVTNVDFSDNKLSGVIPGEITDLDGLIYLNLSMNLLSGEIPPSIGNMRLLESIDLSRNQLSGKIPLTITNLSFLNELDLSYNHLKGEIPRGTQLQSFEASNFAGNYLCGPPLPVNCNSNQQIPGIDGVGAKNGGHGVNWSFVSIALGYIVGFWAVVAPLFIYRSWRYTYFCFLDDMWYKLQSLW